MSSFKNTNTIDFDTEFIKKEIQNLQDKLSPLDKNISYPDKIKQEAIKDLIKDIKPERTEYTMKNKVLVKKVLATAAVFMILFAGVAAYLSLNLNSDKIINAVNKQAQKNIDENKPLPTAKNYDEIKAVLTAAVKDQEESQKRAYAEYDMMEDAAPAEGMMDSASAATPGAADESANFMMKATADADTGAAGSDRQSQTNTQVENVDEADIVKLYKDRLYYVNNYSDKTKIIITKATKNGNELEKLGEINYHMNYDYNGGYEMPRDIFVKDNYLVAMFDSSVVLEEKDKGTASNSVDSEPPESNYKDDKAMFGDVEESPQVDYYPTRMIQTTKVIIYDVSDPKNIKTVRTFNQDGRNISSRLIGDNLYIISQKDVYETEIKEDDTQLMIPYVEDTIGNKETICRNIDADCISIFPDTKVTSYVVVSGLNIKNNEQADTKAILGTAGNVYSSIGNLYVFGSTGLNMWARPYNLDSENEPIKTTIVKYSLDSGKIKNTASGSIVGTMKDQYSADEYMGNLRIAVDVDNSSFGKTPVGDVSEWVEDATNNLYVLDENLKQIGSIENLTKNEYIKSVRFMGKKAYVVTFRTVDPFFVLDLENPTAPKVLGELKIPGFSEYLHPLSENYIIGLGQNTKEIEPDRVTTTGLKLSLFDVTNPLDPKEVTVYNLGSSYSEASYNPKSIIFLQNGEEDVDMGFPITFNKMFKESEGFEYEVADRKGFIMFNITKNNITKKGAATIKSTEPYKYDDYVYDVTKRGAVNGNILYTISEHSIKAYDLNEVGSNDEYKLIKTVLN